MFTILKQRIIDGCIPACTASVLNHHQIAGRWDEQFIYKMYDPRLRISGFDTLRIFLEGNGLPSNWVVKIKGNPIDFKQFIIEKNESGIPLLCPINQGPDKNAHCVVLADSDSDNLVIYDPSPKMPDLRTESYESFQSNWAGSFLWFEKV
jgi:hypothetical protein